MPQRNPTRVSPFIRILAGAFTLLGAWAVAASVHSALGQEAPGAALLSALRAQGGVAGLLLMGYVAFLIGWTAVTGKAPDRFFPIASLRWKTFRARYLGKA